MNLRFGPVFPVLPSYTSKGRLDLAAVASYVEYLKSRGAMTLMTTAGTSQFNLLDNDEIIELNVCASETFQGRVICGLPSLAERQLAPIIDKMAVRLPSAPLMLTYPERSYRHADIVAFFARMTRLATNPFYVHGIPLHRGIGGTCDYDATLVTKLTTAVPNIVGMKEESSTYESGFELCEASKANPPFEYIVAGGSMRRFLLLQAAGAQSFFSGVGSLIPSIELAFMRAIQRGDLLAATHLIAEYETPVFSVFMRIGWHRALRHAAKRLGLISRGERRPMVVPTKLERAHIDATVDIVLAKYNEAQSKGML